MSEKLTAVLEQMKTADGARDNIPTGPTQYMHNISEMGMKAMEAKIGDAANIISCYMIEMLKASAQPHPVLPDVRVINLGPNDMRNMVYTALLTGVGLAINEEIR